MKCIFTSLNSAEVGFLKSVLEEAGIECFIRNESQAYQTLAVTPELWVLNEADLIKAQELCKRWRPAAESEPERWRCPTCGEELESQFGACWKCAAAEAPAATHREPDAIFAEEPRSFIGPWKPFQPWMVLALAILAVSFELYWRGPLLEHPMKTLYYPVHTPLWVAGQQLLLEEGWKNAGPVPKWLWRRRAPAPFDTNSLSEDILRDALAFAEQSRFDLTNITKLRANLVVLLAQSSPRKKYAQQLQLLNADPRARNFVTAVRAVYETNREVALSQIGDPFEALGETAISDKFAVRWRAISGQNSDAIENRLKANAAKLQRRDFLVANATITAQALGVIALCWLVVSHRKFRAARRTLVVPWAGWEGLGVLFAAWTIAIVLQAGLYQTISGAGYAYGLLMCAPAPLLLWWRHWKSDKTSLRNLFSLSPPSRTWCLVLAGLVTFTAVGIGYAGFYDALRRFGLTSNWAEGIYEAELYEPWNRRWIVLANAVLLVPIGEEVMFRGILFPALRHWMPASAAIFLSSVVFAAYHYYSWPGFLALIAFGSICAMAVHATGSLIPAIIAHTLNNLFAVAGYSWIIGR